VTGARRLSQAISEGDGISILALVRDAAAASTAEGDGAEGLAVMASIGGIRDSTSLPILFRADASPEAAQEAGADACLIVVEEHDDEERLEELHARATRLGLEIVVDVHDDESLAASLERIEPEIFLLSPREADDDEDELERILDLLPDVPAGKLAIADLQAATRDDVVALERAGVDAVLVGSASVAHLVGGAPPAEV
jgi:indole-3-glycerol phosphate synthase